MFSALGGEIKQFDKNITWNALSILNFDPHIKKYKQKVQNILCLQDIMTNQLPNPFTNSKEVIKLIYQF